MRTIGEWLRQFTSEGIERRFCPQIRPVRPQPRFQVRYRSVAAEVAQRTQAGRILEVGPGPGYIAIEIARLLPEAEIVGLDASHTMVEIASHNAAEANVANRIAFRLGNATQIPFAPESFGFVVSSSSLHEWKVPIGVFNEVYRVLKDRGEALIGDLRRDAPKELKDELAAGIDSWVMRWGLRHSFSEAYSRHEILGLLAQTDFSDVEVAEQGAGLTITLRKPSRRSG